MQTALALLLLVPTVPAWADQDDAVRGEIVKIGQVTGDNAYEAQLSTLLNDRDHAKKLVAAGLEMVKSKSPGLTYNGALTLGQLAADLKDYQACETLYRVATK